MGRLFSRKIIFIGFLLFLNPIMAIIVSIKINTGKIAKDGNSGNEGLDNGSSEVDITEILLLSEYVRNISFLPES